MPVGAMQTINPETERSHYRGAVGPDLRAIDIWIGEEKFIGKGLGSSMMSFAIDRCFTDPHVKAILVDPLTNNLRVHKFYKRLGFEFLEHRQFEEDNDSFVFKLTRAIWG